MIKALYTFSCLCYTGLFAQTHVNYSIPPAGPSLFTGANINTGLYERDFALSPDGTEIFYTLQSPQGAFQTILYVKKDLHGKWGKPEIAPFAGTYSDLEPAFSPNGNKLFFSSNRPLEGGGVKDFDLWYVERKDGRWVDPKNLGSPVNTTADEYYPSMTLSGNLYFTAAYNNSTSKEDIFLSVFENGKYMPPVPLDSAINSPTYEFNAFVAPDEKFIIFTSYGRKDDLGRGDLYISTKDSSDNWQPAKNMSLVNSERTDYCPFVSFDRKFLFFTSERNSIKRSFPNQRATYEELTREYSGVLNGGGNIYRVNFEEVLSSLR